MAATRIMPAYYSELGRLRMLGGNPALDLANTTHWREGQIIEFITNYTSLVDWSVPARLLSENEARMLQRQSKQNTDVAIDVLQNWLQMRNRFREHLALLTSKQARRRSAGDVAISFKPLARDISQMMQKFDVADIRGEFGHTEAEIGIALPLARSFSAIMNLILFTPHSLIHLCEGDPCGGFFINNSRSKPRRWCAMDSCGNRAKINRHRALNA